MEGTVEHRDVHNMYGFYNQMATQQGHIKRDNARPFVLTRSFFAGSQKYGAVWTGDNAAEWSHLQAATPMLLSLNVAGIVFSGADVGGFFGNPDEELLSRWYQAAAFQPFFRGHAHIDTKRGEPWLFGEKYADLIRDAIRRRYAFLPYIYTVFHEASTTGMPIMRPLWAHYPTDSKCVGVEDSFLLGRDVLVHPITQAGKTSATLYLPPGLWYALFEGHKRYDGGMDVTVQAPLESIPVFLRGGNLLTSRFILGVQGLPFLKIGGSVVPKRERARRSTSAMVNDPITLYVFLDSEQKVRVFFVSCELLFSSPCVCLVNWTTIPGRWSLVQLQNRRNYEEIVCVRTCSSSRWFLHFNFDQRRTRFVKSKYIPTKFRF